MEDDVLLVLAEAALSTSAAPAEPPDLTQMRQLLSALPLALAPASPPAGLRRTLLDAVGSDEPAARFAGFLERFCRLFDMAEVAAQEVLGSIANSASWQAYLPGVSALHFEAGQAVAGADTGLITFAAGMSYPRHTHVGEERMLILQGGIVDDVTGKESAEGDIVVMAARTSHSFSILPGEDCVAAVVVYGGEPVFE